jgi:hypothetical protein
MTAATDTHDALSNFIQPSVDTMTVTRQQTLSRAVTTQVPAPTGLLQRQCACGKHTAGGGECAECKKTKVGLQRKLTIGSSTDPLELEADRVANQVMAAPTHRVINSTAPRIQCSSGEQGGHVDAAPASVDQALANSGQPLEPALRQDMEQRFGQDFSRVRVHFDKAAQRSARDVNAHAYTVGNEIVFGEGEYRPSTGVGVAILAHELTHVLQEALTSYPGVLLRRAPLSSCGASVQAGETDLRQVARRLKVDPDDLLLANPQIKDPTRLSPGQVVYLPLSQNTYASDEDDSSPSSLKLVSPAKSIGASVTNANSTQKVDASPANQRVIHTPFGIVDVGALEQAAQELTAAHNVYLKTGKVPPTRNPWSWFEIKTGKPMSRAERYDAMVKKLGNGSQFAELGDVTNDNRDPEYLTKQEFSDEFWARYHKERDACDEAHWFRGPTRKCQDKVAAKYGGERFVAWRESRRQELYRQYQLYQQKVEGVISSGPVSLAGRVIGRLTGGEKWEEFLAGVGSLGDAGMVVYAGSKGQSVDAYQGGAGLEVGRGMSAEVAPRPAANSAEGKPSSPAMSIEATLPESKTDEGSKASAEKSGGAAGGGPPPYEGPSLRKLGPTEAPPSGVPALTRRQASLVADLRAGRDVIVPDIQTARALLSNMPDIRPYTGSERDPWETAPKGTYRGDLINIRNPAATDVHEEGTAPGPHRRNAHYNIVFPNGKKATILIVTN